MAENNDTKKKIWKWMAKSMEHHRPERAEFISKFKRKGKQIVTIQAVARGMIARNDYRVIKRSKHDMASLFMYVVFWTLLLVNIDCRSAPNGASFYATNFLEEIIAFEEFPDPGGMTLHDVVNVEEYWQYTEEVMLPALFQDGNLGKINNVNVFYGPIIMRQIRSKASTSPCYVPASSLKNDIENLGCYSPMNAAEYDGSITDSFGPAITTGIATNNTKVTEYNKCFQHTKRSDAKGLFELLFNYWIGPITNNIYDLGNEGFICNFNTTENPIIKMNYLKNNNWIDTSTRAVFVEFTLYNAAYKCFTVARLMFEFSPHGGVHATHDITTRLYGISQHGSIKFYIYVGVVLAQFGFLFFYLGVEFREMCTKGCKQYTHNVWNYLELINYGMLFLALTILVMFEYLGVQRLAENQSLYFLNKIMSLSDSVYSVSIILATIKIFKYLKASDRLSILIGTLEEAADDIVVILLLVFVLIAGFSFAFYCSFSGYLKKFKTIPKSFLTSFSAFITADFHAFEPKETDFFGYFIVYTYIFTMASIILSLVIAIVEESFNQSQERVKSSRLPDPLGIRLRLMRKDLCICLSCRCRDKYSISKHYYGRRHPGKKYKVKIKANVEEINRKRQSKLIDYKPLLYKKKSNILQASRRTTYERLDYVESMLESLNEKLDLLSNIYNNNNNDDNNDNNNKKVEVKHDNNNNNDDDDDDQQRDDNEPQSIQHNQYVVNRRRGGRKYQKSDTLVVL